MNALLLLSLLSLSFYQVLSQGCVEFPDCNSCTTNDPSCGWCTATQQCLPGTKAGPLNGSCLHSWEYESCEECSKNHDCRSCNDLASSCQWCTNKLQCVPLGYIGCTAADVCPCEDYTLCSSCATKGCDWCDALEICIEKTNFSLPCERRDAQCLCEGNPTCSSCSSDFSCGWCDDSNSCVRKLGSSCIVSKSCEFSCERAGHSCDVCAKVKGCGWCSSRKTCMDINTNIAICDVSDVCPSTPPPLPPPCDQPFSGSAFVGGMFLVIGLSLFGVAGYIFYKKRQAGYNQLN